MKLEAQGRETEMRSRRLGWPLALTLTVLILALLGAFLFYRLETWPGRTMKQSGRQLEKIGREARDVFVRLTQLQPRVTINNRVYFEQTSPVAEWSVLARRVEVEHEMTHTWAGSSKRIKLHGTFLVKAGFDLHKRFSVDIRPDEIVVHLPYAEILSVEQQQVEVLAFENGFWNRISPVDIENELAQLPRLAREKSRGLAPEAEATFVQQLREKFHPEQPVRAIFPAPSPSG